MSIEALKEQARRHEQREEWRKALEEYKQAIAALEKAGKPDIGLYNRVGDIYVRLTLLEEALSHYEKAVDLYVDEGLDNNAIAVCKKIVRNVPLRHQVYLRMGQIRARQGFLPDARTSFLTYAERMQKDGDLDESFRALVEFCDLAPGDVDLRLAVAEQMTSHHRFPEAVEQMGTAYRALLQLGETERAAEVGAKAREIDPDVDLTVGASAAVEFEEAATESGASMGVEAALEEAAFDEAVVAGPMPGAMEGFETTALDSVEGSDEIDGALETEPALEIEPAVEIEPEVEIEPTGEVESEASIELDEEGIVGVELEMDEVTGETDLAGSAADSMATDGSDLVDDLPYLDVSFDEPSETEEGTTVEPEASWASEPPAASDEADEDEDVFDLPLLELPPEHEASPAAAEDAHEEAWEDVSAEEERAVIEETAEAVLEPDEQEDPDLHQVKAQIDRDPDNVDLRQRMVELAYRSGEASVIVEAFMGLGDALERAGDDVRSKVAYRQVLHLDQDHAEARAALGETPAEAAAPVKEVAAHEDYVDLGSMILGDQAERSTRFTVTYEEPTGDEEADFAKMLSQFKEKVSQNLDVDDTRAHYDLGTAYKEMGLLDEAVAEFQQALRGSGSPLPTYEILGQTFLEMNNPAAAVRSLERALEVEFSVEDELLAIYYYLGIAYEEVGEKDRAVEFYDRVFSLDINFADVTERLRALR